MACANDGSFFHVATLADVNEHVHEYIPVLSRPMALQGYHETTWSNVFVGFMDKELKIAVARPAFKTKESLLAKIDHEKKPDGYFENFRKINVVTTKPSPSGTQYLDNNPAYDPAADYDNYPDYENPYSYEQDYSQEKVNLPVVLNDTFVDNNGTKFNNNELIEVEQDSLAEIREKEHKLQKILHHTDQLIREQQVLLGVVGVDVPVLRLISKVSPKYQMGVGEKNFISEGLIGLKKTKLLKFFSIIGRIKCLKRKTSQNEFIGFIVNC